MKWINYTGSYLNLDTKKFELVLAKFKVTAFYESWYDNNKVPVPFCVKRVETRCYIARRFCKIAYVNRRSSLTFCDIAAIIRGSTIVFMKFKALIFLIFSVILVTKSCISQWLNNVEILLSFACVVKHIFCRVSSLWKQLSPVAHPESCLLSYVSTRRLNSSNWPFSD